jgi:RNA polymerase sigma-70 factor, ECF subfamily
MKPAPALATSLADQLGVHRPYLLRFARRRLNDGALAEDLVHDVFAAVLEGRAVFGERASLRTWLVGILKHKIVDAVRSRAGECSLEALHDGVDATDAAAGWWRLASDEHEPSRCIEQRQALARALDGVRALPPGLRCAFELRVVLDRDTHEVCRALAITEGDVWVRVHRARRRLAAELQAA